MPAFMRIFLLTIFLISFETTLFSQAVDFKWVRTFGSSGLDLGRELTLDAAGNIYATGQFTGTIDFDPGPGIYNLSSLDSTDIFILKLDADGNFVWAKQLGGSGEQAAFAIALDNAGNVYYSGIFENVVDFDPGAGVHNLTASTAAPAGFICKLTGAGNFLWAVKFNESRFIGLSIDAANNVIGTGSFSGIKDFDPGPGVYNLTATAYAPPLQNQSDILVLKLDAAGNFVWAKQMGGYSQDFAVSVALDPAGNVYTTGQFNIEADLDPGTGVYNVNAFQGTNFISKLDAAGNFVWGKTFGGSTFNGVYKIKIDASGNIYTAGVIYSLGDFDPGPGTYLLDGRFTASGGHIFISKLNPAGNFIWAKKFGGPQPDFCTGLALDASGNVYTTGGFTSPADFDPNAGVYQLTSIGIRDIFISKLDSAGNFVWAKALKSTGNNNNSGYSIFVDASENVYTIGVFQGTTDFDPETGVHNVSSSGGFDIFIHKMSQCLSVTTATITTIACNTYTINNQTYTSSGIYTQTLTNVSGCDSIITLNLTIGGTTKTDTVTACGTYIWQGQTYSTSGNYIVTLPGADGCDSLLKLRLTIKPKSLKTVDTTICEGQNYAGYTASGTYTNTFISMNGCDSIRTLNLIVKSRSYSALNATICEGENYLGYYSSGTFKDTLVGTNGCDSIRTLQLIVNPRKYTITNIAICQGQTYFTGGGNQTITGTYRDTLQGQTGCDSIITTNLLVHSKPNPNLGQDKDLCKGTATALSPGAFATYLWQDQSTASNFIASDTGTYWVTVTDNNSCSSSDTFKISSILPIPQNFLKSNDSICQYEKLQIIPLRSYESYLWSTGSRQSILSIEQPGRYELTVKDVNGCPGKDTITITQKQCATGLFVPTGFTPNGDGRNDVFHPKLFGNVKSYLLRVYNRWGALVFQTADLQKGWDGKISGMKQNNGVFVWTCLYQLAGDQERLEKGTVVLIQ